MKRLSNIILLFFCICNVAIASGINYYNQSWSEIKAKAKAENKYIIINCYTVWTDLSQSMESETLSDTGIVAFINAKFIAVKMDMEKGEGSKIAMKFHIHGGPAYLFFNSDGRYVYQTIKYANSKDFMVELNNAIDTNKQYKAPGYSASLDVDYPEFYKKIFLTEGSREFPSDSVKLTFLNKQKDLFSEISWAILSMSYRNNVYAQFFLDNYEKYKNLYGPASVVSVFNYMIYNNLETVIKEKSKHKLNNILKMTDKYDIIDPQFSKIILKFVYSARIEDWNMYSQALNDFVGQKGYGYPRYLSEQCWHLYQKCDNMKVLENACGYMKEIVNISSTYHCLGTYSALLYKAKQFPEAKIWAEKALIQGKKDYGNDNRINLTDDLLNKILQTK